MAVLNFCSTLLYSTLLSLWLAHIWCIRACLGCHWNRTGGLVLQLNVQTSVAGLLYVELQSATTGQPLPGRALADAQGIRGNFFSKTVSWSGVGSSLSALSDPNDGDNADGGGAGGGDGALQAADSDEDQKEEEEMAEAGVRVRMRVAMTDAKLYSASFVCDTTTSSSST